MYWWIRGDHDHCWISTWLLYEWEINEVVSLNEILDSKSKEGYKSINIAGSKWQRWEQILRGKKKISDFPDLILLSVGDNLLEELIIRNCPNLKYIIASHNKLTKLVIENCPNVTDIYTHHNELTDAGFPNVEQFPNLEYLSYYDPNYQPKKKEDCSDEVEPDDPTYKGNRLSPQKIAWLNNYTQSNNIRESREKDGKRFSLKTPEELKNANLILRGLRKFKLDSNGKRTDEEEKFTSEELNFLENIKEIDLIELTENDFYRRINGTLNLDLFPNLERLICNYQGIKGILDLSKCKNLKFVYANNNWIEEIILGKLEYLEELHLSGSRFKNSTYGIKKLDLTQTPNLKVLQCDNNLIQELNVKHLGKLESLRCYECEHLGELDVSGLKNLKELYCFESSLKILDWVLNSMLIRNLLEMV